MTERNDRHQLLQGTLDMLILRTLHHGPTHGHGIASQIFRDSGELFEVDHGSLYPALQRLQRKGFIRGEWGVSKNNRRAKFYSLTQTGRKQFQADQRRWRSMTAAIAGILGEDSLVEET